MWWSIARREFTDLAREGHVRWGGAVLCGLFLVALLSGWQQQRLVAEEHDAASHLVRESWLSQPPKDPHSAAHYGSYVFKPRPPLTLIDAGVSSYAGVSVWLEAHKQNEFQFRPAQDRTAASRFIEFSVAGALQVLVPVLIVVLAHARVAGERQAGTLRQLVAAGVPAGTLAIGKTAGVAMALAVWLAPLSALGAAALVLSSGANAVVDDVWRTLWLCAAYLVYFVVVLTVGLGVSARSRTPALALALLVAWWAINALVVPRAATYAARAWFPTPSAFDFATAVHHETYDGLTVHEWTSRRAAALRQSLLRDYHVTRVEDLPVNFRGVDYLDREEDTSAIWDRHYGRLWAAFDGQARVHQLAGFLAPLVAMRSLSMGLAGGDVHHHRHFAQAAEAYRREFVQHLNGDLAYSSTSSELGYRGGSELWARVPPFVYRAPSLTSALVAQRESVAALAFWLLLGTGGLVVSMRTLRVD